MKKKVYNNFLDKFGNVYKFEDYMSFAQWWFNQKTMTLRALFPTTFSKLQRAATDSKEARTKVL